MKTALEIVDIVWKIVESSSLKAAIDGGVYKVRRPVGSNKTDIVINTLGASNEQLQQALVNVNIHVPNKPVKVNGVSDNSQPDFGKLAELTRTALLIVKEDYSGLDWHFELQQHNGPIQDEDANSHYVNIRIDFYSQNI